MITPIPQDSIITLYKQVPWDNSYKDIRLFDNGSQRDAYFAKLEHLSYTKCSIAKLGKSFRLEGNFNDFTEFTYLTFENPTLGAATKRFYAFITAIDFVNVNCCEISYEIDWIQSYLFLFDIGSCLVEREHVANDGKGLHTVPENLETGEYIADSIAYKNYNPAVLLSFLPDSPTPSWVNGVVDCTVSVSGTKDNLTTITDMIKIFNDAPERIVQITMIVEDMINSGGTPVAMHKGFTLEKPGSVVREAGETYTIVNNKLRIYPYFFFTVDNFMGNVEQFRWENFAGSSASFRIDGVPLPRPAMECSPIGYMLSDAERVNQGMSVVYDNFPSCPYANDTFKAWVSQYGASKVASMGAKVAGMAISIGATIAAAKPAVKATATAVALASGAITGIQEGINQYQEYQDHKIHAQQMNGGIAQSGLNFDNGRVGFRVMEYRPKMEMIKRIDGFFTRYGYRVDTVKKPNIRGRQFVNYVKTVQCQVGGKVPVDARNCMENALNSGVSFWHVDNIGQHLTSNPIV